MRVQGRERVTKRKRNKKIFAGSQNKREMTREEVVVRGSNVMMGDGEDGDGKEAEWLSLFFFPLF